jgi:hypothetical protein
MTLAKRLDEMAASFDRSRAESVIPADFEESIKRLADRLELAEIRSADQGALKNLEGQIVGLVTKLDASKSSLSPFGAFELGVDRLLAKIDDLQIRNQMKLQAIEQELIESTAGAVSAPAEAIRCDVAALKELQNAIDQRSQDAFDALHGAIKQLMDRLTTIDEKLSINKCRDGIAAPMRPERAASGLEPIPPSVANAPGSAPVSGEPRDYPTKMKKLDARLLGGGDSSAPWGLSDGFAQGAERSPETRAIETDSNSDAGQRVESPNIPTDFETVIKKLAERTKSFETWSGERDGCENLEWPIVALPAAVPMPTKQAVLSIQQPILPNRVPDAPVEYGSYAVRIRTRANVVGPNVASEITPGDISPPWTIERAARPNFVGAARRAAVVGGRPGVSSARSPAAILMQKRTAKQKISFAGKKRGRIAALIVGISFIALALGTLRLAIVFFDDPDLPPLRPSMSQIDGPPSGLEPRLSKGAGRTEAPAPDKNVLSGSELGALASPLPGLRDEPSAPGKGDGSRSTQGEPTTVPPIQRDETPVPSKKSALSGSEQGGFAGPQPAAWDEAPTLGNGRDPPRSAQGASAAIPPTLREETPAPDKSAASGSEPVALAAVPSAPSDEDPTPGKSSSSGSDQVAMAAVPSAPSDQTPASGKSSPSGSEQVASAAVSTTPLDEARAALRGTVSGSEQASLTALPPAPRNQAPLALRSARSARAQAIPPVPRELASGSINYTTRRAGPAAPDRQALGASKGSHTQGVTNPMVATQADAVGPAQNPITNLICWLWSLASN